MQWNRLAKKITQTALNKVPYNLDKNGKEFKREAFNMADRFAKTLQPTVTKLENEESRQDHNGLGAHIGAHYCPPVPR